MRIYRDKSAAELLKIQKSFPALFMGKCLSCRFFEDDEKNYRQGICRRYAPRAVNATVSAGKDVCDVSWPQVDAMDWCGEQAEDEKKGNRFARRLRHEVDESGGAGG